MNKPAVRFRPVAPFLMKYVIIIIILLTSFEIMTKQISDLNWEKRILNIHPSLLPKFKGLNTHSRVLEAGERLHGCTVHYVNEKLDNGEILDQAQVKIKKDDNSITLASRVLIEEHKLYSKVVRGLITKENRFLTSPS